MPATPATELNLVEVFSSLQGEGVLLGRRQLFVRLAGCNLSCAYCDTAFAAGPVWQAESAPGSLELATYANPAATRELTALVASWQAPLPLHHSLALTGGEPLLQAPALAAWLPDVARILPVYLETNGTLPAALAEVLACLTWVSMDVKLARVAGEATPWEAHAAFMTLAGSKLCQVKAVIDVETGADEVAAVARQVAAHAPLAPLVLQPRTVAGRPAVTGRRLLALQAAAAAEHPASLVIPQLHPLLAVR